MTLWDNEETGKRAVKLSAEYEDGVEEMIARFSNNECNLTKVSEAFGTVTTFTLTNEELDALVEATLLYRQDQRLKEEALQAQIDAILKEIPAIQVRDCSDQSDAPFWVDVVIDEINYESDYAGNKNELLQYLQEANQAWQKYQEGIRTVEKAKALIGCGKYFTEIGFDEQVFGREENRLDRIWKVTIPAKQWIKTATTPEELLTIAEEAIALLDAQPQELQ